MVSRLSAFVIWALVAGAAVFWSVRLLASPLQAPPQTTTVAAAVAVRGDVARLLGSPPAAPTSAPAAPDVAARFKLLGVVAPRRADAPGAQGVALLSVDGKPARAVRVGAVVDGEWRLQAVVARGITLVGPGGSPLVIEMPPLPAAATGRLPPVGAAPDGFAGSPAFPGPAGMPSTMLPAGVDPQAVAGAVQAPSLPQVGEQAPVPPPAGYMPPPGSLPQTAR
jgi:general secretion pathway protein C